MSIPTATNPNENLQRFGQCLVNSARLMVVKHQPQSGNMLGYGTLVFDNGQEVMIPAADSKALIETLPNMACNCSGQAW
jgi:hypothetical protein